MDIRIDAQRRIHWLNPNGFADTDAWLGQVRQSWGGHLDALEHTLRAPRPGPGEGSDQR